MITFFKQSLTKRVRTEIQIGIIIINNIISFLNRLGN